MPQIPSCGFGIGQQVHESFLVKAWQDAASILKEMDTFGVSVASGASLSQKLGQNA